tara:strand:+ start:1070 stop:1297 length:228 start_codon:yes stop_codon:yes gene_type:complete
VRSIFIFILLPFLVSCSNDVKKFLKHKNFMEKFHGPCSWVYVGYDYEINNPAIVITPPNEKEYVLWNQNCSKKIK